MCPLQQRFKYLSIYEKPWWMTSYSKPETLQDYHCKDLLASEAWVGSYVEIGPQVVPTQVTLMFGTMFPSSMLIAGPIHSCTSNSYIYFSCRQETICGVEQMLKAAHMLFCLSFSYLLSHWIFSHITLDTGPYVALWSGNVFERISVIFTEILTKLNAIMTKPFFFPLLTKDSILPFLITSACLLICAQQMRQNVPTE